MVAPIVVIDSPLVTYKRRDTEPGEEIPEARQQGDLADTPTDLQIIILDNEDPPPDVQARVQYQHFSRSTEIARFGFFPIPANVTP